MTLQTYLLLLRPGRTIAATALIVSIAFVFLVAPLGVSLPEFALLALCLLLPLTLGSLLIAPLHEVAHRSSFPLLPGADRQLFRSHAIAFVGAAFLLCGLAFWLVSIIPAPAACGLILSGLALPQLDSHRGKTIGGISAFGLLVGIGLILAILARTHLVALGQFAPWSLFAGGVAFAVACFRVGFVRDRLRARSTAPVYYAPQSILPFVGTDILQYAQSENARAYEQQRSRSGSTWSATPFLNTLRDWLRIVEHARFGKTRWSRSVFCVFAGTTLGTVTALLAGALFYAGMDWQRGETYCRLIVEAARSSGEIADRDIFLNFVMMPQIMCAIALSSALMVAVPPQPFPLSRARLATVLFLAFERRVLLAIAGSAIGTVAVMTAATLVADQPWNVVLLHRFFPVPAFTLIAANLAAPAILSSRTIGRIAFGFLVFPGFIIATFASFLRHGGPQLPLPAGATLATLTLGSVAYTWFTFRRHYRTCDLNRTGDSLRRLGFRLG